MGIWVVSKISDAVYGAMNIYVHGNIQMHTGRVILITPEVIMSGSQSVEVTLAGKVSQLPFCQ